MADIFISYKSERRPAARHLKKVLDCYFQTGADDCVWYDYGLVPGHDFGPRIMDEIAKAKVVVVLWCGMAVKSEWVQKEASEAQRTGKFVPCRIEACSLPNDFGGADTINLSEWDASPRSPMLDRLLDDVARRLGRDAVSRISRLRELEEDWRGYGAPSLAQFALGKTIEPDQSSRSQAATILSSLGSPPPGLTENLARHWANAQRGDPQALFNVAWYYAYGKGGLPKDEREAVRLYGLAAEQGYARAQNNLGFMHANGQGVTKDESEAVRLYKLAADQGDAGGQRNLGVMYRMGLGGLPKDESEAVRLYQLSANQGDVGGIINLGYMFESGLGGLHRDESEAARLYKLAADRGDAVGQSSLATLYRKGRGVPLDAREAARLYKLAAEQGDAVGQATLGFMLATGQGVPKDKDEALRLYKLAARGGDIWAQTELKRLGEKW